MTTTDDNQVRANPYQFSAQRSDDDVKTDLELTCNDCGEHICDIEADDNLGTLLGCASNHTCTDGHDESNH